jgi:hypothetical protein
MKIMSDVIATFKTTNNQSKQQQHPFHVLGSSKLPIFIATFVGGLAISVIVKVQNVANLSKFLTIGQDIIAPFFAISAQFSSLDIPDPLVNVRIFQFLALILATI